MPKLHKQEAETNGRCPERIAEALLPLAVPLASLKLDPDNARIHGERSIEDVKESLRRYGQQKPVVVRAQTRVVVAGNGTVEAARQLGWTQIAANVVAMTEVEATGYGLADNRTAESSSWNFEVVARLERLLAEAGEPAVGWSDEEIRLLRAGLQAPEDKVAEARATLAERFIVPPFSVLDARQGYWQDRKRAWLSLGIQSELGRGGAATFGSGDPGDLASGFAAKVSPGGSPGAATRLVNGKTVRGDGAGKPLGKGIGHTVA